jgi:16S rRNA A1518/A1519 N6-dimethyltransferase RsmA/KsgA/DIM1 with predicted DNA glycosylase/AP lyase activity
VRSVAHVERLFHVGRGSFRPVPRVDSTVIRIEPIVPPPLTPRGATTCATLTRVAFSWRRKQLQKIPARNRASQRQARLRTSSTPRR